jgi:aspartyl/asparaginyl-tRNA synthetase
VPPIFTIKGEAMLSLNKDLIESTSKFIRTIKRKFEIETLPKKLQNWYKITYTDCIKELSKLKIKLTLSEEAEWEEYFNSERKKVLGILAEIEKTDKEIDQMVYELYELTEEEIRIVEESN